MMPHVYYSMSAHNVLFGECAANQLVLQNNNSNTRYRVHVIRVVKIVNNRVEGVVWEGWVWSNGSP